jgi:hypothetical protein
VLREAETETSFRSALREHAGLCVRASNALVRVFEEPHDDDEALRELHGIAERGDIVLHETLRNLIRMRAVPFEHGHVQEMIIALDAVLDRIVVLAEEASALSVRRRHSTAIALAKVLQGCCRQFHLVTLERFSELRILVDLGVLLGNAEVLQRRGAAEARNLREPDTWHRVFRAFKSALDSAERVTSMIEETILESA